MVETRTIVYDEQLQTYMLQFVGIFALFQQIEAYQFVVIMQKFPNHFHDC